MTQSKSIQFIKMHGIGNDYVYLNLFKEKSPGNDSAVARLARQISDRHFGIGSDGLILVQPSEEGVEADVRMRMFNADGSEAEMCGNGVRCVCKLAHDYGITSANPMKVQTGRGVLSLDYTTNSACKVDQVTVEMGEPILKLVDVPVDTTKLVATMQPQTFRISTDNANDLFEATFVSMGNPHAVIDVDDLGAVDLAAIGPQLENHPAFPKRMNVHFVKIHSPGEVTVLHWERGSGATLACGTGACAVCVAGVLTGKTDSEILAHLPGGDLKLQWQGKGNPVWMSGPATEVFTGEMRIEVCL